MEVTPSLSAGQRVRYCEAGVISSYRGTVRASYFERTTDRILYLVDWDDKRDFDVGYPRSNLFVIKDGE